MAPNSTTKPSPVPSGTVVSSKDLLWVLVFVQRQCEFNLNHFQAAMLNLIFQPNINSSSIMRADILYDSENIEKYRTDSVDLEESKEYLSQESVICEGLIDGRILPSAAPSRRILRVLVPRNPNKDDSMIQSCLLFQSEGSSSILYAPHLKDESSTPYYHPAVSGICLHYIKDRDSKALGELRLYYRHFPSSDSKIQTSSISNRLERTALRLITTAYRHSTGTMNGYEKRVHHDVVVDKVAFQNRYIELKNKHARFLVDNWVESTDPKKHVFEDLSIAAFLIELWLARLGRDVRTMTFADLGCGNGLLVYILIAEGYRGYGIEARRRKTWDIFPQSVQDCLFEQVLVPSLCFDDEQAKGDHISEKSSRFHDGQFPPGTFLIGNHSDELTPWIPLLGHPFIVIPCCSHSFAGAKYRYPTSVSSDKFLDKATGQQKLSTYGALVEYVARISSEVGWKVEREMLRIPSTRNASIIGFDKLETGGFSGKQRFSPKEILKRDGGAAGFVENVSALMSKNPRSH
ncbi:uncharacterized protein V2V93DRAFT_362815 [Kockiozyma suomiensis]|uniref:uncharacterized protein n=1 Tax=Kockiozyma suomiensis TaxID=1337062 RepID=UPI00334422CF